MPASPPRSKTADLLKQVEIQPYEDAVKAAKVLDDNQRTLFASEAGLLGASEAARRVRFNLIEEEAALQQGDDRSDHHRRNPQGASHSKPRTGNRYEAPAGRPAIPGILRITDAGDRRLERLLDVGNGLELDRRDRADGRARRQSQGRVGADAGGAGAGRIECRRADGRTGSPLAPSTGGADNGLPSDPNCRADSDGERENSGHDGWRGCTSRHCDDHVQGDLSSHARPAHSSRGARYRDDFA